VDRCDPWAACRGRGSWAASCLACHAGSGRNPAVESVGNGVGLGGPRAAGAPLEPPPGGAAGRYGPRRGLSTPRSWIPALAPSAGLGPGGGRKPAGPRAARSALSVEYCWLPPRWRPGGGRRPAGPAGAIACRWRRPGVCGPPSRGLGGWGGGRAPHRRWRLPRLPRRGDGWAGGARRPVPSGWAPSGGRSGPASARPGARGGSSRRRPGGRVRARRAGPGGYAGRGDSARARGIRLPP